MAACVWLVGEHNPYGDDPRLALFPRPPSSAGGRLCRVLGMTEREYLRAFERRNLLANLPWSAPSARRSARRILAEVRDGDALVLLGARVAAAFGFSFSGVLRTLPWTPHATGLRPVRVLILPHPSGRCRLWNDSATAPRARAAVEALRSGEPLEPIGADP